MAFGTEALRGTIEAIARIFGTVKKFLAIMKYFIQDEIFSMVLKILFQFFLKANKTNFSVLSPIKKIKKKTVFCLSYFIQQTAIFP